jgi:hypothetical protein
MRGVLVLVSASLFSAGSAGSEEHPMLLVTAKPAVVVLDGQAAGQRLINLPDLEFPLQVQPACDDATSPQSISVSVADTREVLGSHELKGGTPVNITMKIPGRQLGPIAINEFCMEGNGGPQGQDSLVIADAFTAHVALRCSNENLQTVTYQTLSLEVVVQCAASGTDTDNNPDTKSSGDQEPPAVFTRF